MRWEDLPQELDELPVKCAAPAWDVRQIMCSIYTSQPVGYHYSPARDLLGVHAPGISHKQFALVKSAAAHAVGRAHVRETLLPTDEIEQGLWVKVAYSPSLRSTGEALNFFPGTYPGGIPNHPSPLAAMLTSALVGGGLGYGAGWVGEKMLPNGYGSKLKRTGAILGALMGAAPGAMWAYANHQNGHKITDAWPHNLHPGPTDKDPNIDKQPDPATFQDMNANEVTEPGEDPIAPAPFSMTKVRIRANPGGLLPVKLGSMYKDAVASFCKRADFGDFSMDSYAEPQQPSPYDVNINHLGQTLWQGGASQPLIGAAMGTMLAASRMPDPNAQDGWVTGNQLGQLAVNGAKDYVTGLALGALINATVGTPFSAPTFGVGNAALGLIRAGVKSLLS